MTCRPSTDERRMCGTQCSARWLPTRSSTHLHIHSPSAQGGHMSGREELALRPLLQRARTGLQSFSCAWL